MEKYFMKYFSYRKLYVDNFIKNSSYSYRKMFNVKLKLSKILCRKFYVENFIETSSYRTIFSTKFLFSNKFSVE